MNRTPIALATLVAAAASAQMSMPRIDTRPAYKSTIDVAYASVSAAPGQDDCSGTAVTARLYVYGNTFVTATRNDATFDTSNLKAHEFVYGIGTTESWGQGTVTAAYTHGKVSGDAPVPTVDQNIFSLGYELGLAQNLTGGFAVNYARNGGDYRDVTAAVFSLRYDIAGGISATLAYSSEDILLHQGGASSTWTVGARYSF